jgi:hypothetical protein
MQAILDDRGRLGGVLMTVGIVGMVAALVLAVGGWLLAGRAARTAAATIEPITAIVVDMAETIDATGVIVSRTTEAIGGIESATRSTARALDSVSDVIGETAALAGGGIADSLDSAVAALPALVSTGRVIDRTMRALSLVGVDYDPDVPLDEALAVVEESLRPIPDQLREQVVLLETVQSDLEQIGLDAGALAAVLLEARIDMMATERALASAAESAALAVERVSAIESEIETYDFIFRLLALAAAFAFAAGASGPLLLGARYRRRASPQSIPEGPDAHVPPV